MKKNKTDLKKKQMDVEKTNFTEAESVQKNHEKQIELIITENKRLYESTEGQYQDKL